MLGWGQTAERPSATSTCESAWTALVKLSTLLVEGLMQYRVAALYVHLVSEFNRADTVGIIDAILFGSLVRAISLIEKKAYSKWINA